MKREEERLCIFVENCSRTRKMSAALSKIRLSHKRLIHIDQAASFRVSILLSLCVCVCVRENDEYKRDEVSGLFIVEEVRDRKRKCVFVRKKRCLEE